MNRQERAIEILEQRGALLRGHFLLSSGLHSDRYCQCARALEHPEAAGELAKMMGDMLGSIEFDAVAAPAIGGIVWGYALASACGVRSLFAERGSDGRFALRRGFGVEQGERVLLAEDVVTTGGSVLELAEVIRAGGAKIAGFASIVDRSAGAFAPQEPFVHLATLRFETYENDVCPMCASGSKPVKPGSRAQAGVG